MRVRFDFSLDAWIRNLEIEADSLEDAKDKLARMSVEDIVEYGCVDEHDITNLDSDILEETVHVKVSDVVYDYDEDEDDIDLIESLPTEFEFDIDVDYEHNEDLEDLIADAITDETDCLVYNFRYKVVK